MMLELLQIFIGAEKDLKVVSEKINGSQATLKAEYCSDGKRGTSIVPMLLEGGSWKVGKVKAKVGLKPCK